MNIMDRKKILVKTLKDPDLDASPTEIILYVSYWIRAEMAHAKMCRARRRRNKYEARVNHLHEVFKLRQDLMKAFD